MSICSSFGKPRTRLIKSKGPEGTYLIAKRNISKGENVVVYWGEILDADEPYRRWLNSDEYRSWAKYLRGLSQGTDADDSTEKGVVDGNYFIKEMLSHSVSLNLAGVYVNDYMMPISLDLSELRKYLKSKDNCNLSVISIPECPFPVYQANRKIRKGEKLSVHYGLGYWLLQLGVPPQEIVTYIHKLLSV